MNYLIPANSNRGKLIFGFFRKIDLFIFGGGLLATLVLLLIFQNSLNDGLTAFLVISPGLFTGLLVLPIPNQHNVLVVLQNIYHFYFDGLNIYHWKGWCSQDGEDE